MLLKEKYPELKLQFDENLNGKTKFATLTIGSRKKIWWRCNKGKDHVWQASVNQRTSGKKLRGCPVCAGKKVVKSNCLATTHPKIAFQWYNKKNKDCTPYNITAGGNRKVWWKCPRGPNHIWQATPKQRTRQNNVCPICGSLGFRFPSLAKEWHPTKNGNLTPFDIPYSAHMKVWWKCHKGFDHIWQASPNTRTSNGSGCPICAGYKVVYSNCLATTHPEIAAQWHYKKNHPLTPRDVHAGSHKKVWWKCNASDDHEWSAVINSRVRYNLKCPMCSGRRVVKSNSLAAKFPAIAELWNKDKNSPLSPYDVVPYSGKIVWWKCPKGHDHVWQATVANVVNGSTCPVCMNRKITTTNNIFALYPELKEQWDIGKNQNLNPLKLSAGGKIKVWWICKRNPEHTWIAAIKDRTKKGSDCPFCAIKLNFSEIKLFEIIKEIFPDQEVLYRNKPKWLRRMELDVFIPKMKLAFEYQGPQHFKPIKLFGGHETYIAQVKRDRLKKDICDSKSITLIYVYFSEKLSKKLICKKLYIAGIKY